MKKIWVVEIRGQKTAYQFATKSEAEAYAITATAWSGGAYRLYSTIISEGK